MPEVSVSSSDEPYSVSVLPGLTILIAGRDGDDAKSYQEQDLRKAITRLEALA